MHRFLLGLDKKDKRQADHINRNTLDNRKENLRIVSQRKNQQNKNNTSKFGHCIEYRPKCSKPNPFAVVVRINYKKMYVGQYPTLFDAILAREAFYSKHGIV
jgi:hypothetical protein